MTAVSGEQATDVAALGLTKPLTRAQQKIVCGSVLRQAEERVDRRKLTRRYFVLGKMLSDEKQLAALEKLGELLFPEKKKV